MKKHTILSIIRRIALLTTMTALCVGIARARHRSPARPMKIPNRRKSSRFRQHPHPRPDILYEPLPEGTSQPFSIAGNGEVLDDIEDGDKEFYTITTQNNNQFFIVVDKARASENVYMLARVDETDIAGFIEEYTQPTATPAPQVVIQQPTPEPTPQVIVTEPEEETGGNTGSYALIGVAALVFIAGAYYFQGL